MKLLNFTPIQLHMLGKVQTDLINKLLNVDFKNPADDEVQLRLHAYLNGKLELVTELLADEWPDPVERQEE
jgi:hypothetical protein